MYKRGDYFVHGCVIYCALLFAKLCRLTVIRQTHVSTDEAETTDGVADDSGGDSDSEEDAWDVCAVPKIFTTEGKVALSGAALTS
eukprot:45421-Pyramimonas_sp.AAC.2